MESWWPPLVTLRRSYDNALSNLDHRRALTNPRDVMEVSLAAMATDEEKKCYSNVLDGPGHHRGTDGVWVHQK